MNDDSLPALLGFPPDGADFGDIGRGFIDHVKTHVQKGADSYDDEAIKQEEDYLCTLFPRFFDFTVYWIRDEIARNKDARNHPDATALKNEAKGVLRTLQDNIITFTIVSMRINRFMILVRDEIKKSNIKSINYSSNKKIKWTNDTGVMLGRNKKRKIEIDALLAKYETAMPVVQSADRELKAFHEGAASIFSHDDAEKVYSAVRSALRVANFDRARGALREMGKMPPRFTVDRGAADEKIKALAKTAEKFILLLEKNAENLVSEDGKLFLGISELRLIQDSLGMEARKIRAYIVKYNLPYMEYKLDQLSLLRDKLLVVGSLDSLMTLYLRLVGGMAGTMTRLEDVRLYEAEVLGPIRFMQGGQFAEIPRIMTAAEKTVEEFRRVRQEYQDELSALSQDAGIEDALQDLADG